MSGGRAAWAFLSPLPPAVRHPSWQVLGNQGHGRLSTAALTSHVPAQAPRAVPVDRLGGRFGLAFPRPLLCSVTFVALVDGQGQVASQDGGRCVYAVLLSPPAALCDPEAQVAREVILPEAMTWDAQTWGPADREPSVSQRPGACGPRSADGESLPGRRRHHPCPYPNSLPTRQQQQVLSFCLSSTLGWPWRQSERLRAGPGPFTRPSLPGPGARLTQE